MGETITLSRGVIVAGALTISSVAAVLVWIDAQVETRIAEIESQVVFDLVPELTRHGERIGRIEGQLEAMECK